MISARRWTRARGKQPYTTTGTRASSTNPRTWATWQEVQHSTTGDGYGFMCGDGIACHDLDDCFTTGGELKPWAQDILDAEKHPLHVEISRSGKGLHIFVEADEGPGRRTRMPGGGCAEYYSRDRFIVTTFTEYRS